MSDAIFDGGNAAGGDPAPASSVDPAVQSAFVSGIQQAFSPVENHLVGLEQSQQSLAREVAGLRESMQRPEPEPVRTEGGLTEEQRRQWSDPKGFFREQFSQHYEEQIANDPRVQQMLTNQAANIWEGLKTEFDDTYGPGQWDKLIKPSMEHVSGRLSLQQLADSEQARVLFGAIKGSLDERDLYELREATARANNKAREEAYSVVPGLINGVRVRLPNNRISPEAKDALARVEQSSGIAYSEDPYNNFEEHVDFESWNKQRQARK